MIGEHVERDQAAMDQGDEDRCDRSLFDRDRSSGKRAPGGSDRRRPEQTPSQRALGLLVRREHSKKELANKLFARGVDAADAAAAIERMASEGWQDEARFAAFLARSRAVGGHGPIRIRAELQTHGLDGQAITAAFASLAEAGNDDWDHFARELVRRRFGQALATDPASRRKAADFLFRRGFTSEQVRSAVRREGDE